MRDILYKAVLGDIIAQYDIETDTANIGLKLYPVDKVSKVKVRHSLPIDSLVQIKLIGDDYAKGYSHGKSMHGCETTKQLQFYRKEVIEDEQQIYIKMILRDKRGNDVYHHLIWDKDYAVLKSYVEFINRTGKEEKIEMISSASISGISPFVEKNIPKTLYLNRLRSKWSMEGRRERNLIETYQLEPCWKPSGATIEKFGQVGSMPVRGFFPLVCIEDTEQNVSWGMQLGVASSWQIEVYRKEDDLCLSGGIADRDFGHWMKIVPPAGRFLTPPAYLTVTKGGFEHVTRRLTEYQAKALQIHLVQEEDTLPVIFNEFCTTWGNPSEEKILALLDVLKGKGISYFVIDAGWHADKEKGWEKNMGDWVVSKELFPNGLRPIVEAIKDAGMLPGIWFEMEICGCDSVAFQHTEHLLKRDGVPITVGDRRFWDMRDPWVQEYLAEKIIVFLRESGFRYLKVDYNDNIGIGVDHPESFGEGLREQIIATEDFFRRIREEVPDLIIENCASGGHRLVNSIMGITDMSSFSDAHEATSIPIIAANLHDIMLPRQEQIWAVLRQNDSAKRLYYSLISTFLGRMCLSGDVDALSKEQWSIIEASIAFYKKIAFIVREGNSERFGTPVMNYAHPENVQVISRYHKDGKAAVIIAHSFENSSGYYCKVSLRGEGWQITDVFGRANKIHYKMEAGNLLISFTEEYEAVAIYMEQKSI